MTTLNDSPLLARLRQMNAGRGFLANLAGFFIVACMIGLANVVSRQGLGADINWLARIMLILVALYFFVPYLVLLATRGRPDEN